MTPPPRPATLTGPHPDAANPDRDVARLPPSDPADALPDGPADAAPDGPVDAAPQELAAHEVAGVAAPPAGDGLSPGGRPVVRLVGLLAGVGALALVAMVVPVREAAAAVAGLGPLGWVGVGLLAVVLLAGLVPRTPISIVCGALLGPVGGAVVAVVAALVSAALMAAAGRTLGREFVVRHAGGRLRRLDRWVAGQGVLGIAAVRSLPIGPFGLSSYLYGATGVPWRTYLLGTAIAAPPAGISYALLGAAVVSDNPWSPVTLLPMAAGALLTIAALVAWRRRARSLKRQAVG